MAKTLTVVLAADVAKFKRDLNGADNSLSDFAGNLKNLVGPALIGATAAAGAFAVKLATDGVKAAMEDEASLKSLAQTLQNVGAAHYQPNIEEFISGLERSLGVADTELRPAYDRLIRSTDGVEEANKALNIALDVSAGTGKSLSAVVEALGKAYDGNTVGLSRLGAGLDRATLSAGNLDQINGQLAAMFAGQATTAANTYEGQVKRVETAVGNLFETMAGNLMKALGDTNDATQNIVDTFAEAEETAGNLAYGVGVLVGELLDLADATKDSTDANKSWWQSFGGFVREQAQRNNLLGVAALSLEAIGLQAQVSQKYTDDLNTAWADYRRAQQGVISISPDVVDALNDISQAAGNQALSADAAAKALLNTAIASGQVPSAAQWAQRFDIKEMLENVGRLETATRGVSSATRDAEEPNRKLTASFEAQGQAIDALRGKFEEQQDAVEEAKDAIADYVSTIQAQILGGIDLGAAYEGQFDEQGNATGQSFMEAFNRQIEQAEWFGNVLQAIKAKGADQLLIDQIAGLGPAVGGALGQQMIDDGLVKTLSDKYVDAVTAAEGVGKVMVPEFLKAGEQSAIEMLGGTAEQIQKDLPKWAKVGTAIGKPIAANIKAEIMAGIAEAVAAAKAAGEAARAAAAAAETERQRGLTETQSALSLQRLVNNANARTGYQTAPVLA